MEEPQTILDYAPRRPRFAWLTIRRWKLLAWTAAIAIIALIVYGCIHGPTSAQARLDTWDVRYLWYGIPLKYQSMPEPWRSKLLKLAAGPPPVAPKWIPTYIDNPEFGWNGGHRYWYCMIVAWADVDPTIGHLLYADMVDNELRGINVPPPACSRFFVSSGGFPGLPIATNWRDDPDVQEFCRLHGYTPPPASAATTSVTP